MTVERSSTGEPETGSCAGIVLGAPPADAVCESDTSFWPFSCQTMMHLTVRNCLTVTIEVQQIDMVLKGEKRIQWNFDDRTIEPGDIWEFEQSSYTTGQHELVLSYHAGEGETLVERTTVEITNSVLEAARRECEECNGDFAGHGIMGIVSCLCRMEDFGRPCNDGEDCEGKCVGNETGFRCSEFRTVFGCHNYLPDGWSKQNHTPPVFIPHICVD